MRRRASLSLSRRVLTLGMLALGVLTLGVLALSGPLGCSRNRAGEASRALDAAGCAAVRDHLAHIAELPPKAGEPLTDEHARAVLALGSVASPCLVEAITDTTPTSWTYGFQYRVGDMALVMLGEVHHPARFPFPDGSDAGPGDVPYRDLIESPGMRARLRDLWEERLRARHGSAEDHPPR